jgi:predicted phosphoadenosine phosphosulfate sulfurtransferase
MSTKHKLGIDVLTAAKQRIKFVFDSFPRIYVSFSGGKDSTCMLHLVMEEAKKRNRKVGVLLVDLEGQYKITIDHIQDMFDLYADYIEPYWVCLPIALRNAVSTFEPKWCCWEPGKEKDWIRQPPKMAITLDNHPFDFYEYNKDAPMEFEEFVPKFGQWYAQGKLCACFVGIRSDESLNRFRTIKCEKTKFMDKPYTTKVIDGVYNVYPIYDWKVSDDWLYVTKYNLPYNKLYDYMYQAGLKPSQMRICQPYGDDQRRGLWLFHIIEPETWSRVVARVNGANQGALYIKEKGNINGNIKITKPEGHTWQSFAMLLLNSMPPPTKEHFENKIAVFLHWWSERGYPNGIPDEMPLKDENAQGGKRKPSWRRICKALLRNDYWCKGLSFSQNKAGYYEKYKKIMRKRRQKWGIF